MFVTVNLVRKKHKHKLFILWDF